MSIDPVSTILLTAILGILGFVAKKLNKILDKLMEDVELSHKRHDISDVVHAHNLREPFNSKAIAEDRVPWPNLFKGKPPREV